MIKNDLMIGEAVLETAKIIVLYRILPTAAVIAIGYNWIRSGYQPGIRAASDELKRRRESGD
jgi:hypothetical protein